MFHDWNPGVEVTTEDTAILRSSLELEVGKKNAPIG